MVNVGNTVETENHIHLSADYHKRNIDWAVLSHLYDKQTEITVSNKIEGVEIENYPWLPCSHHETKTKLVEYNPKLSVSHFFLTVKKDGLEYRHPFFLFRITMRREKKHKKKVGKFSV
jgi:hypothetical protein